MTRLDKYNGDLIEEKNLNLLINIDDLFDISGGGNKGRKLNYVLSEEVIKKA